MKYVTALKDYNHKQTGDKVITKGSFYLAHKENQNQYWILNDNDKYMWIEKHLFRNGFRGESE